MVLPLRYHFAPGEDDDGVTLIVPVEVLNRVPAERCEWLVPGLVAEKIALLIKALPKQMRRNFVPAPDYADACVAAMSADEGSLTQALSKHLQRMTGVEVERSEWDLSSLPPHLLMRFEVIDDKGKVLKTGRQLDVLQKSYVGEVEETLLRFSDNSIEKDSVSSWNFGDLPESVDIEKPGITMQGFPALQAHDDGVGIKLFATRVAASKAMPVGVRALYKQVLRDEIKYLQRKLPNIDVLSLRFTPFGSKQILIRDIIDAAIDETFIDKENLPRTRDAFMQALDTRRDQLISNANLLCQTLEQVFEQYRIVAKRLDGSLALSWIEAAADLKDQMNALIYQGFVTQTGLRRLKRLPVYFQAMGKRLDAIDQAPDKDRRRRAELLPVWEKFKVLPRHREDEPAHEAQWETLRWAFEELRISLFAQDLGTAEKVSVSRLENRVADLS